MMKTFLLVPALVTTFLAAAQPDEQQSAWKRLSEADAAFDRGALIEAYSGFSEILPFFRRSGNKYREAYINHYIGDCLFQFSYCREARHFSLSSRDSILKYFNPDTVSFFSLTLQNLGAEASCLGDYDLQMKYYRQHFEFVERVKGREDTAMSDAYYNMGVAYGRRRLWKESQAYMDTSLKIAEHLDYQAGIGAAYAMKAYYSSLAGDFARAADFQRSALRLVKEPNQRVDGHLNLGDYYQNLRQYDLALAEYGAALKMLESDVPDIQTDVKIRLQMASVFSERGDDGQEIIPFIDQIIADIRRIEPPDGALLKRAMNFKASVYLMMGEYERAGQVVRAALRLSGGTSEEHVPSLNLLSKVLAKQNKHRQALETAQKALRSLARSFRPATVYEPPALWQIEAVDFGWEYLSTKCTALYNCYRTYGDKRALRSAVDHYLLLDSLVMQRRRSHQNLASRALLASAVRQQYADALAAFHAAFGETQDEGYFSYALSFSEKYKSLLIAERLSQSNVRLFTGIPADLADQEEQLLREIELLSAEIVDRRPGAATALVDSLEEVLLVRRQEQERLLQTLQDRYPQYVALRYSPGGPGVDRIRKDLLSEDEVLVEYFIHEKLHNFLYILILSGEKSRIVQLSIDQPLTGLIRACRSALVSQDTAFFRLSHQLYTYLIRPIEADIEGKKLVIVTDGVMSYMPFEALLTEPVAPESYGAHRRLPFLLRTHPLRYCFSVQVALQHLDAGRETPRREVLALAPVFFNEASPAGAAPAGWPPLPRLEGSLRELETLGKLFRGRFLQEKRATKDAFYRWAGDYNLIHIATHTLVNDDDPGNSRLIFARTENQGPEQAILRIYDLYNMMLRADLVTLSACDTGFDPTMNGEGIASLAHGFAFAGSPNIVMSLWKVNDQTTAELMGKFYRNLKKGMSKGEAMHQAKIDYLDEYHPLMLHPYYWSCFIYTGDQRPVSLKSPRRYGWMLPVMVLLMVLVWRNRRKKQHDPGV